MENQVLNPENQVITYPVAKEAISVLSEKYMQLKIDGVDDIKSLKVVKEAKKDISSKRRAVETRRKELKQASLERGRKIDSSAKELQELIEPIETHVTSLLNKVEDEKARIAAEVQQAKEQKIKDRKQELLDSGAVMGVDGFTWGNPVQSIPEITILMADDEKWGFLVSSVKAWKSIEDKRKADEAEALRKLQEQQQKEADERKQKDDELAERERKIKEKEEKTEREEAEKEKEERRRRVQAVCDIGLRFDGIDTFVYKDIEMNSTIMTLETEKFNIEFDGAKKRMTEIRAEEEKQHQADIERQKKEAADKAVKDAEDKRKADEKANADKADKEKAAEERKARLRPDKDKLEELSGFLWHMEYPELKSNEAKEIIISAKDMISKASEYIREKAQEL